MRCPILMYHEVTDAASPVEDVYASWTVSPDQFRDHLDALHRSGYTGVSAARWLAGEGGPKPVVLTFDDGFAGNVEHAIPALRELGWTATFFVISGKMGCPGYAAPADWRAAAGQGMDVASHTVTHPFVAALPEDAAFRELSESRAALEDAAGAGVLGFSWPNGDAHPKGGDLLRRAGYAYAATSRPAFATSRGDPLSLPRLPVRCWHDAAALLGLVDDGFVHRARMMAAFRAKQAARLLMGRSGYARFQQGIRGEK